MERVKGYCHICGEEIKGNVGASRPLECGMCVQRRVKHVERIELEAQMSILNRENYATARKISEKNPYHPTRKWNPKALRASHGVKRPKYEANFLSTSLLLRWKDQLNE